LFGRKYSYLTGLNIELYQKVNYVHCERAEGTTEKGKCNKVKTNWVFKPKGPERIKARYGLECIYDRDRAFEETQKIIEQLTEEELHL